MSYQSFVGYRNLFYRLILCAAFLSGFQIQSQASESIALSWQPAGSGNAGFYIYYGTGSHAYSNIVTVGNTNQAVISGLTFGTTYYFAAQAYDSAGHESALSGEVSFVAGSATLTPTNLGGHRMSFSLQGSTGQSYIVQVSTNLVNWVPCLTNAAPFQYTTTPNPAIGQQYFRAYRLQ
jgi:hypothetical protein